MATLKTTKRRPLLLHLLVLALVALIAFPQGGVSDEQLHPRQLTGGGGEPHCTREETAWGKANSGSTCFSRYGISRWGWTNGPYSWTEGNTRVIGFDIWAGAGQCQTARGIKVGTGSVTVTPEGRVIVRYSINYPGADAEGPAKFYLGSAPITTVSPGQLPYSIRNGYGQISVPRDVLDSFYFYIHFDIRIVQSGAACETKSPTMESPTERPSAAATKSPTTDNPITQAPTQATPTQYPSRHPTHAPTRYPTREPTESSPTERPSAAATNSPTTDTPITQAPAHSTPTAYPSRHPTHAPTRYPTREPTEATPTERPSAAATNSPTTDVPITQAPAHSTPTAYPSRHPTHAPTRYPTREPTEATPTERPSAAATNSPTTDTPITQAPAHSTPTAYPSRHPTHAPTRYPTREPTESTPTERPSAAATNSPTTDTPITQAPTHSTPTAYPTRSPTNMPTPYPTSPPSDAATRSPTMEATPRPTSPPSRRCTRGETGWGKGTTKDTCFSRYGISRWGWTNGPYTYSTEPGQESNFRFQIWLGAGQCNTANGILAGTGVVSVDSSGRATISYRISNDDVIVNEVRAYIGSAPITSVSPGQMPIRVSSNPQRVNNPFPVPQNFYYYIHFDVTVVEACP